MNISSTATQVNAMTYVNSTTKNAIPDKISNEHIDLSKHLPNNMVKAIDKLVEENDMTQVDKWLFAIDLQMTMSDYAIGKDIHPTTMVGNDTNGNPIHSDKIVTKQQLKSIDFDEFLSKALSAFTKGMNETSGEVGDNYKRLVNNYSLLQENYNQVKSEPIYA